MHISRVLLLLALVFPGMVVAASEPRTIPDPVSASQPVFGRIDAPGEIDLYTFTASRDIALSVEVVTPVRPSARDFRPVVTVYRPGVSETSVPVGVPAGYTAETIVPEQSPTTVYEPISAERLARVGSRQMSFTGGQPIYLTVSEPSGRTGDYIVGLGSATDFSNISIFGLFGKTIAFKLGLSEGRSLPIQDAVGLFLAVSGLIVALGSVLIDTVVIVLGRRSVVWTHTFLCFHGVTKWLTWIGLSVYYGALAILYRQSGFSGPGTIQEIMLLFLILNVAYASFVMSPRLREQLGRAPDTLLPASLQRRVLSSTGISLLLLWGQVALLCWYVVVVR